MKLKRFVAIVISLAMVLSIVPAFSLTASAAGTTGVIDALGGEVLWNMPDGSFNDTAIGTGLSGWSATMGSGNYANLKTYTEGNCIQFYKGDQNNNGMDVVITSPGYGGEGEDAIVIEWVMHRDNPNDLYFDFSFLDKNDTEIAFLKLDRNFTSVTDTYRMGFPASGTDCAIVATNNGDGTHKVEYYVGGSVVSTETAKSGEISGFKTIKVTNGGWSADWNNMAFANLTIGAVYPAAETEVEVSVQYTADGEVVKTVNGRYDTAEGETGLALDAYTYYVNGGNYIYTADATTMSESGTIAMTRQANWNGKAIGDSVTYGGKKYSVTGTNLIPNGDFSQGTLGWFNGTGSAASFFTSNGDGTMSLTSGGTGQGGASSLYRAWKVEPNTTYVYTYTSTGGGQYHKNSLGASFNATGADGSNVILQGAAGTNTIVFTTGANENYLIASYRWLGSGEKFGNYGLYTVEEVIETTADTVKAGMDSLSLPLATKTSITVPTTSTDAYGYESTINWTSSNADVLAANGTVTAPDDITIVTLTPSTTYNENTVTGDAHTVYVFPQSVAGTEYNSGAGYYDIGTENIISAQGTNASFEGQSLEGWLAHTGATTNGAMVWVNSANAVVPDGEWAYASRWSDPITGSNYCTIDTMWEVEAGTYYLSFYAKKANGADGQVYVYYSTDNAHHTAVGQITSEAWYEKVTLTDDWKKYEYIITADALGYIGFTGYNLGTAENGGTHFDDFELYTAVQAAEDLVSVTNPEDITVIAGNEPVLPKTVTGVGERGSAMTVDVAWNDADFGSEGTVTVTGTAAGMSVSVDVVVLPETFAMDDVVAYAGQNTAAIHYFPIPVTGTATFEFDVVFNKLVNSTITLGDAEGNNGNCPIFGGTGDAISIQTNTNGVNIRSWGTTGGAGSADRNVTTPVVTGETYRFLIVTDIDSDTWSAIMTDKNGVQTVVADGHGYRKLVDQIDSITVLDNNSSADTINVSNIKVYAPAQASAITTYTFVATGSVSDTYTVKGTNAETIAIPHYDGHIMKTRSISGTTITATYEATTTSTGSWYMRNNFTDDNWISQSKYIGSHNAFADDDSAFVNEGGALYGDTGASSTGTTAVSNSQTQTVGVVDQLNAGVRYFDIRLSRQKDGTFATVHGPAFENFRDVAISMAQWAKENPGEVIILDFQTMRDALYGGSATGHYDVVTGNTSYYGEDDGDDNQYVYDALVQLFEDTGLADYMTTNWDRKYGALTSSGTVTAILPFGKGRAVNCQGGYFVNRSALNNDVTYTESSSYSTIVSNLDSTYSNLTDGATISTIHAYTTPFSLLGSGDLIQDAQDNNPNWINEANFYNWMAYGKGDVFMMNDAVSDIDVYYEALNKFNRTGSTYSYTADFTRTDDNVTITGAQANVPFSTKWTVEPTANTNTYTIDGKVYTAQTAYELDLMQFNTDSVQPTGTVTVTFPKLSTDATTVDALLSADGTTVYATSELGQPVSIETTALADVILATVAAPGKVYTVNYVAEGNTIYTFEDMVPFGQEVYAVPAGNFYLATADKAYILNSAAADSHTAAAEDTTTTFTVDVTIVSDNAVIGDTFANNDGSNDCNNTDNMLFVGSSGISDPGDADADASAMANNGGNVGSPRIPVLTFNVPTVADGQAVKLNLYVAKANQNLNKGGSMKLAVGTADVVVDETQGYVASSIANTANVIWSDQMFTATGDAVSGRMPVDAWVTVDVTEFVKAAAGDTITFTLYAPTAGAYVADREKAVAGGAYEGKAAYMEVVDAYTVDVIGASKITRNGNLVDGNTVTAYEGAQIKLYETNADTPAFTNETKVYKTTDDTGVTDYITVTGDDEYYAATVGVAPVDGAQVRIGDAVDSEGKVTANSGLRFITTVDYTDSLANVTGATFGVEITAEGSDAAAVKIPADKWQTEGEVFTSALTNLAEGNFNRKFTATPYVTADGQTFYGTPVTRSIYQVAAGLLANDKDGTEYPDMEDTKRLYAVLNAYVNQTGIRLSLVDNELIAHDANSTSTKGGKYSGNAFFTVGETTQEGTKYTVTLTLVGENTEIKDYWNEYVRINNNNSSVKVYTELVANEDGTYTLTFDTADLG